MSYAARKPCIGHSYHHSVFSPCFSMLKYYNTDIVFQEFPDEVTLAINLSLCPNGCPGCHSAYLQGDIGDELTEVRLLTLLDDYRDEITCVGLMGGDNDPEAVMHLFETVRFSYGKRLKTGWYSGRSELPKAFQPDLVDYLKLGPYVAECGPLNAPTTNQRMYRREADGSQTDITHRFWKK